MSDTTSSNVSDETTTGDLITRVESRLRYWLTFSGVVMPAVLVILFIAVWWSRRDRIPKRVVLATAGKASSYRVFGDAFCDGVNRQVGRDVMEVRQTRGSGQNVDLIDSRDVPLGLYQGGSVQLVGTDVVIVAPVYREVVHILVKASLLTPTTSVTPELSHGLLDRLLIKQRRPLFAGAVNSGMRLSAAALLAHYGFTENAEINYVSDDAEADVVMATTGMFSDAMERLLKRDDFLFLSLQADAISHRHRYFVTHEIPRGFYRDKQGGPLPKADVKTVSTTAFLVAHRDTSPNLIRASLNVLYETGVSETGDFFDLIPRDAARPFLNGMPLHSSADEFYSPLDVGYLASVMESLAASKDLTLAFFAGIYLLWNLRRRSQQRKRDEETYISRERLDDYVDETIEIESRQIGVHDRKLLERYLDEVTRIKLRALDELTDEALRDDRAFSIFLMQCANLINKLQLKIITEVSRAQGGKEDAASDIGNGTPLAKANGAATSVDKVDTDVAAASGGVADPTSENST